MNYTFRMHDPRVGRFFTTDPLAPLYPWNSPYAFSENRVIDGVELEGAEWKDVTLHLKGNTDLLGGEPDEFYVVKTDVDIKQNVTIKKGNQEYAVTVVNYEYEGNIVSTKTIYEPIVEGGIKPSASYDYSQKRIEGKTQDDIEYVINGKSKISQTAFGRYDELVERDANAPDNIETVQDLEVLSVLKIPAPSSVGNSSVSSKLDISGRSGKQKRLKEWKDDPKASSADRGWLKNDQRHIETGNKKAYRIPRNGRKSPGRKSEDKGYELAHGSGKGQNASSGKGYEGSKVKNAADHRTESRIHQKRYRN